MMQYLVDTLVQHLLVNFSHTPHRKPTLYTPCLNHLGGSRSAGAVARHGFNLKKSGRPKGQSRQTWRCCNVEFTRWRFRGASRYRKEEGRRSDEIATFTAAGSQYFDVYFQ